MSTVTTSKERVKISRVTFTNEVKNGSTKAELSTKYGIPEKDIIIESESNNTRENAIFSKIILDKQLPAGKFLLITSAFHMRRAIGCFSKAGVQTDYYSTDRYSGMRSFEIDNLLIPNAASMMHWQMLIHEMIGFVVYKISGYA